MKASLIISIVPHNEGEKITSILKKNGATGSSILMGRGTAENSFLLLLGIGDTSKDIVLTLVPSAKKTHLIEVLATQTKAFRHHYGIVFATDADWIFPENTNQSCTEELIMAEKKHKLITVILNKGFADDAMAAARKVGAGGGTIIHARGTAKEEDVSFMGIKLVPEKETLMILVEKEKTEQVIQAIRDLPCLKEPGSGIIYSQDVDSFTGLGHQAEK